MRFVQVNIADQQAALTVVGLGDRLIRNRTQLGNAIHGCAGEFKALQNAKCLARREPFTYGKSAL